MTNDEEEEEYDRIMKIPIYDRIKYGCNCYMCVDTTSASCMEVELFLKFGSYNANIINQEIKNIKKKIKIDNYQLFKRYMLCLQKFNQLYEKTIEKRYRPGGEGYLETKKDFENKIKNM